MEVKFSKIITIILLLLIVPACKSGTHIRELDQEYNRYFLPKHVLPIKYYIELTPNIHNDIFVGNVKILIEVTESAYNITIHQYQLEISPEKVYLIGKTGSNKDKEIKNDGISESLKEQFYIIHFREKLAVGMYELFINQYFGNYQNGSMIGLYSFIYYDDGSVTHENKIVTNLFEPTYARYAFPCFDEPALKATFKIFLYRPHDYISASNAILIKSTNLSDSLVEDEFKETVKLPTYMIAFLVCNLKLSKKQKDNIHQAIAQPQSIQKNEEKYSIELANHAYKNIEIFLNKKLPLKKIYHLAVPDNGMLFPAVENWGLIIYQDSSFLMPSYVTTIEREGVAGVIIHELAHQWFGNLVTLKWWDYTWLNEGFATYISYEINDKIYPDWSIMQKFQSMVMMDIMVLEMYNFTVSLNHRSSSPKEIMDYKLSDVSYIKGAAIIRMMEVILSKHIFRRGLTNYLNDREFDSATPEDLYRNLDKAVQESNDMSLINSLSRIMKSWDSQQGFPVVKVERNYSANSSNVYLTQKLCIHDDNFEVKPIWYIPINYATKTNPNFYDQKATDWLTSKSKDIKVKDLQKTDWLIINKRMAYYYRVNYDLKNWELLAKALIENHKSIDVHNRAQIVDDIFTMARMGEVPYDIPLKLSDYFKKETEYAPLEAINFAFNFLDQVVLSEKDEEKKFRKFFARNVVSVYHHFEEHPKSIEKHAQQKSQLLVFSWLCQLHHEICLSKVNIMFRDFRNGKPLPSDLEEQVLCTAMKMGKESHLYYLFNQAKFKNQRERSHFLALACSKNRTLLQRILKHSLSSEIKNNVVDAINAVINQGPIGPSVTLQFFLQYFDSLLNRLGWINMKNILINLGTKISKATDLEALQNLTKSQMEHKDLFVPALVRAHKNIEWSNKYSKAILTYVENYVGSGTTAFNFMGTINIFVIVMFYLGAGILHAY